MTAETATIVFVDIESSTQLMVELGDGQFDAVRSRFIAQSNRIVESHRGIVIKTLGDGFMARFDGTANALVAAIEVQQAQAGSRMPLALRIGMSVGDVIVDDGDCHGTPVVEAARLCAAADGGQILANAVVAAMLRGQAQPVELRELGPRELKGLGSAVAVAEIVWEPLHHTAELPSELAMERRLRLVGRELELSQLEGAIAPAWEGRRAIVVVSGEPGIGKTRLAAEVARRAIDKGAVVLVGRCVEELVAPFVPWQDVVAQALDLASTDVVDAHLERHGAVLARILPGFGGRRADIEPAPMSDPGTERFRVAAALDDLLAAVAAALDRPLLIVLDDAHWADEHALAVLSRMARSPQAGIAIVATYRDTEMTRGHPLAGALADLRRTTGITRVDLRGLADQELDDLVATAAGQRPDAALLRVLADETEGNPFFLLEVLQHLAESGAFVREDEQWVATRPVAELPVPEGVRDVVSRRLGRLPADVERVLQVAAVVGRRFDIDIVESALGSDGTTVLDAVDTAARAGIVEETGRPAQYEFSHAIVRQVVMEGLSTTRRLRLHWAIGSILLDRRPDERGRATYHLLEGVLVGDAQVAADAALAAGHDALERFSVEDAALQFDRALDALDAAGVVDADRRWRALIGRAHAALHGLEMADAIERFIEAAELASQERWVDRMTEAVQGFTILPEMGSVPIDRIRELIARIRSLQPQGEALVKMHCCESNVAWMSTDFVDACLTADRAIDAARAAATAPAFAEAFAVLVRARSGAMPLPELIALIEEYEALVARAPAGTTTIAGYPLESVTGVHRYFVALQSGDRDEVDACLRNGEQDFVGADLFYPPHWRSTLSVMDGRLDDAERHARDMETRFPTYAIAAISAAGTRAAILMHRDDARCRELYDGFATLFGTAGPLVRTPLILPLLQEGDSDGARRIARDAGEALVAHRRSAAAPQACGYVAEAAATLREPELARDALPLLEDLGTGYLVAWGGNVASSVELARAQIALAEGRVDDAVPLAAETVARDLRFGARGLSLRSRRWLAVCLDARGGSGDQQRATELLDSAIADATELGYVAFLREVGA